MQNKGYDKNNQRQYAVVSRLITMITAKQIINARAVWSAILWAGTAAAITSTLVQVLLWLAFTDEFPAVLFRDARLTAALVLGSGVLPPPATFDAEVWFVATGIHIALSLCYAVLLSSLAARLNSAKSLLAGAAFGIVLYAVNLYGFVAFFPWFSLTRGWITVTAHVVFGTTAMLVYRQCYFRSGRSRSGGH